MTVPSRKGLGGQEEEGGGACADSGAPPSQTETSGSSAFGLGQFSEDRAVPRSHCSSIMGTHTQEAVVGSGTYLNTIAEN